jgi:hypothetical protein
VNSIFLIPLESPLFFAERLTTRDSPLSDGRVSRKKNTQNKRNCFFRFHSFVPSVVPLHVFTSGSDATNEARCDLEFSSDLSCWAFLHLFSHERFVNTAVGPSECVRSLLVASRATQIPPLFTSDRVLLSLLAVFEQFRSAPRLTVRIFIVSVCSQENNHSGVLFLQIGILLSSDRSLQHLIKRRSILELFQH